VVVTAAIGIRCQGFCVADGDKLELQAPAFASCPGPLAFQELNGLRKVSVPSSLHRLVFSPSPYFYELAGGGAGGDSGSSRRPRLIRRPPADNFCGRLQSRPKTCRNNLAERACDRL